MHKNLFISYRCNFGEMPFQCYSCPLAVRNLVNIELGKLC
ncbi:Uncharacterised protein [Vibrio cholerae]|nr:Uncharacterised protein [Vibrio cholerae]CSD19094.1 Uncharacterised protein [Vibrio cholerae]